MGFDLHKMYEIPGLVMGNAPYEKYIPSTEELHLLKKDDSLVYETTGKYCVTLIIVHRQPTVGLGELNK